MLYCYMLTIAFLKFFQRKFTRQLHPFDNAYGRGRRTAKCCLHVDAFVWAAFERLGLLVHTFGYGSPFHIELQMNYTKVPNSLSSLTHFCAIASCCMNVETHFTLTTHTHIHTEHARNTFLLLSLPCSRNSKLILLMVLC